MLIPSRRWDRQVGAFYHYSQASAIAVVISARRSRRTLPGRIPHACDDSSVRIEISAIPIPPPPWPRYGQRSWTTVRSPRSQRCPTRPAAAPIEEDAAGENPARVWRQQRPHRDQRRSHLRRGPV